DSAFGFVVMENGATVSLDAAWALNTLEVREACTMLCGTKAGGDMLDGVRINGIRQNRQYTFRPSFSAGGAAFYEGASDNDPSAKDMAQWIATVRGQKPAPTVLPEQAYTVTRILEGIYTSAKTGDIYRF
ncbi:MAG: gfo/Idh/MocA family oxidoreductase, partial [Clostridiales bacterium]|nr:gfo/Idh/MocA family oxidoreductase [Clostridiales bacterium]